MGNSHVGFPLLPHRLSHCPSSPALLSRPWDSCRATGCGLVARVWAFSGCCHPPLPSAWSRGFCGGNSGDSVSLVTDG